MLPDVLLLYAHLSAILLLTVFLTSRIALLRIEVIDGRRAVLERLLRLELWLWASFAGVAASGAALMLWGGFSRYLGNPLLWLKLLLFTAMLLMAWPARRALRGWLAAPGTPAAAAVQAQRRWLMWQAHLLVLLPLAGILLAKGYG